MEDVGHSRLLKFFIGRMDDQIESKVPGEQLIREGDSDVHYEPVITVTKQELSTSRGDMKAQKITITEDVSTNGVKKEAVPEGRALHSHETKEEPSSNDKNNTEKIPNDEKKSKTKIPMLKFKKATREVIEDKKKSKESENELPTQKRKSSIPRLKEIKTPATNIKEQKENSDPKTSVSPRTEEEFDKIFEEIVIKQNVDSPSFINDPEKFESKFEEIIHDYDEKKVEPLNIENIKSRIPMLKRKSEYDIEATKLTNRRLAYKKRSSIDHTHYGSKMKDLKIKLEAETQRKNKNNLDTSTGKNTEEEESIKKNDKKLSNDLTDSKQEEALAISEIDAVLNDAFTTKDEIINAPEQNETGELDSIQINDHDIEGNRSLKKSQSIDISSYYSDKPNQFNRSINDIRRTVSHQNDCHDSHFSNILDEKFMKDQTEAVLDSNGHITSSKTNTMESVESVETATPANKSSTNTSVKQDIVCIETASLIRQSQEHLEITPPLEPKSLEIEVSLTTAESVQPSVLETIEKAQNQPNESESDKASNYISNNMINSESYQSTEKEIEVIKQISDLDNIVENGTGNLKNEVTGPQSINTIINKQSNSNEAETEFHRTKDSIENGLLEPLVKHIDSIPTDSDEISEALKKDTVQEIKSILPVVSVQDDKNIPQINQPIESAVQQETHIRGHPDALFNRPGTPIEDYLPIMRGECNDNSVSKHLATDINIKNELVFENKRNNDEETKIPETTIENVQEQRKTNKNKINHLLSDAQEEDIVLLKGKVNRVLSRLDFRDYNNYKDKQENVDNVPKNMVLSKIALFEQKEAHVKMTPRKISRSQSQIARDLPKIVDEVLKQPQKDSIDKELPTSTYKDYISADGRQDIPTKSTENLIFKDKYNLKGDARRIEIKRDLSYAEVDLGDAVKGRVRDMVVRMVSLERMDLEKKRTIDIKEKPRRGSVFEKIALFEKKATPIKKVKSGVPKVEERVPDVNMSEDELREKIEELKGAKKKYGKFNDLKYIELNDGCMMPALGVGTALLDKNLTKHIVCAAIDLGYRTIDTAYIYGNEKEIGEAINEKISDGTVTREELFIISKLWSTFHRRDLVEKACKLSLKTMGLEYFDLYLIHNPMSFKEGDDPIPKIANVIQYSESDFLDAWFGLESLVKKGLIKRAGVSNFNSTQIDRIIDKGKIKPVVNQVECHPYLTQYQLEEFCQSRGIKLSCYGVLGSKGTPMELKSGLSPVIDDPLVLTMAAGLEVTPAQLLISYQLHLNHGVVVKTSSGRNLWGNLNAQNVKLNHTHISALNALNRNKRNFTFKGMGDTHRSYPFRIPF